MELAAIDCLINHYFPFFLITIGKILFKLASYLMLFGVGVSCPIYYSFVGYLYVSGSG